MRSLKARVRDGGNVRTGTDATFTGERQLPPGERREAGGKREGRRGGGMQFVIYHSPRCNCGDAKRRARTSRGRRSLFFFLRAPEVMLTRQLPRTRSSRKERKREKGRKKMEQFRANAKAGLTRARNYLPSRPKRRVLGISSAAILLFVPRNFARGLSSRNLHGRAINDVLRVEIARNSTLRLFFVNAYLLCYEFILGGETAVKLKKKKSQRFLVVATIFFSN